MLGYTQLSLDVCVSEWLCRGLLQWLSGNAALCLGCSSGFRCNAQKSPQVLVDSSVVVSWGASKTGSFGWIFVGIHHLCQGLNSHDFHIIGDGKLNPIVGAYIPITRIPPIKRWDDHPQYCDLWPWHIWAMTKKNSVPLRGYNGRETYMITW